MMYYAWPQIVTVFIKCYTLGMCTILGPIGESQMLDHFIFCIILQPHQLLWQRLFYFAVPILYLFWPKFCIQQVTGLICNVDMSTKQFQYFYHY